MTAFPINMNPAKNVIYYIVQQEFPGSPHRVRFEKQNRKSLDLTVLCKRIKDNFL